MAESTAIYAAAESATDRAWSMLDKVGEFRVEELAADASTDAARRQGSVDALSQLRMVDRPAAEARKRENEIRYAAVNQPVPEEVREADDREVVRIARRIEAAEKGTDKDVAIARDSAALVASLVAYLNRVARADAKSSSQKPTLTRGIGVAFYQGGRLSKPEMLKVIPKRSPSTWWTIRTRGFEGGCSVLALSIAIGGP